MPRPFAQDNIAAGRCGPKGIFDGFHLLRVGYLFIEIVSRVTRRYHNRTRIAVWNVVQMKVLLDDSSIFVDTDLLAVIVGHYDTLLAHRFDESNPPLKPLLQATQQCQRH